MKLLFRRHRRISRGQALVEFAIILPILVLFLLLAVDFGRVFFGWVALNNSTRIAANEAAVNPDAWVSPVNAADQARYRQQVLNDLQAINCAPLGGGTWDLVDIPDPVFEDKGGTIDTHEIGDYATVEIACGFTFLTPLVGNIMGNPMAISARSEFAIRGGIIAGIPVQTAIPATPTAAPTATPVATVAPTPVPCVVPQMVGETVASGQTRWNLAGFTGTYTPQPHRGNYNGWFVSAQSLVFGQVYPCASSVVVQVFKP